MPVPIMERLKAGEILLMDGATGDELERRGVDVRRGAALDTGTESIDDYLNESDPAQMRRVHEDYLSRMGPWSASANVDAPDVLQEIHEDYLRLGADIIISNNFWTNRPKLAQIGLGDEWERYTRAAGEIAVKSRNRVNPDAYVAGGIAPPVVGDLATEFREQSRLLAGIGVDFMLAEYVAAIDEAVAAVEACATSGLPVFLGLRLISSAGTMQYGESFDNLVRALNGLPVQAILLMCSNPAHVSVALPKLREAFDGPVGAYTHPPHGDGSDTDVQRFARYGEEWIEMGAQIVGGCCGTEPKHIAALAEVVNGKRLPADN